MLDFPGRSEFDLVGMDNMASGYMVAEHLIKLGCRNDSLRCPSVLGSHRERPHRRRARGDVRHRIEPDPDWIRNGDPADLKFVRSPGGRAGRPTPYLRQ